MSAETKLSANDKSSKSLVDIVVEDFHAIKKQWNKIQTLQNQRQRLRRHLDRFPSLIERLSSLSLEAVGNADEEMKLNSATTAQIWREIQAALTESRHFISCIIAPGAIGQVRKDGVDEGTFESILRDLASLGTSIDKPGKLYRQHAATGAAVSEATLKSAAKLAAEKGLAELVKDVTQLAEAVEFAEKQSEARLLSLSDQLEDVLGAMKTREIGREDSTARELEKTQEISINNLDLIKLIGKGAFGKVYQGVWRPFGTKVAVKVIDNADSSVLQSLNIQTEMKFLKNLLFEHVVRYYGAARDVSRFCLVMELMEEGSLHSKIHSGKPFPWSERINLAKQSAASLVYLHSRDIVHSDVKPKNFLVGRGTVKICDFGLTAIVRASQTSVLAGGPTGGTLEWMAPERLVFADNGNCEFGKPSPKADVYSFGVLLWEFATRAVPYEGYRAADLIDLVTSGRRLPIPKAETGTPPAFAKLIEECWAQDESKRPTMQDVLDRLTSLHDQIVPAPAPLPSPAPPSQPPASPAHNSDRAQGPSTPASEASRGSGPGAQHQELLPRSENLPHWAAAVAVDAFTGGRLRLWS